MLSRHNMSLSFHHVPKDLKVGVRNTTNCKHIIYLLLLRIMTVHWTVLSSQTSLVCCILWKTSSFENTATQQTELRDNGFSKTLTRKPATS